MGMGGRSWGRYGGIMGAIALGAVLRFWHLATKPLWLDEVITALFSLGRSYAEVPLGRAFAVVDLDQVLRLRPTSCAAIADRIAIQSVHPPLFFCWLHSWLSGLHGLSQLLGSQLAPVSWVWQLRALPALVGVVAIAAIYQLNGSLFSRSAGRWAAAFMAVSPFAVYLSQEARHYTLPMLLVIFALLGMVQIQSDLATKKIRFHFWMAWVLVNGLGFYVHYFFLLSFIAQAVTLILLQIDLETLKTSLKSSHVKLPSAIAHLRSQIPTLKSLGLAFAAVILIDLPWLPTFLGHIGRPETDWMRANNPSWLQSLAPLYQLPVGWLLMLVAFPTEDWRGWIVGLPMLLFAVGVAWVALRRMRRLWGLPETRLATRSLSVYVMIVVAEFLAIAYILGKDLTQVPRYNFIYFPAVCALLGVSFAVERSVPAPAEKITGKATLKKRLVQIFSPWSIVLVGLISSSFVVSDLVLHKPYQPDQLAARVYTQPELPRLIVMGYQDLQDVALGLSFALAIKDYGITHSAANPVSQFIFLDRTQGYDRIWESLSNQSFTLTSASTVASTLTFPLNVWMIAPGLKRKDFRSQFALHDAAGHATICTQDPDNYFRLGIPYQRYRCPAGG